MRECCICICVYCYRLPSRSHGTTSNTISSIIINDYQRQDGLGVLYTPIKLDPSTLALPLCVLQIIENLFNSNVTVKLCGKKKNVLCKYSYNRNILHEYQIRHIGFIIVESALKILCIFFQIYKIFKT